VRQVTRNAELTTVDLPELKTVGTKYGTKDMSWVVGFLIVRARPRLRSADRASAAARIAPSRPCR